MTLISINKTFFRPNSNIESIYPQCLVKGKTKVLVATASPIKHLCRLLRVEDEAGVVSPQHSHYAQTQAGGVAANEAGRLQQQLSFHQTQLIQQLGQKRKSLVRKYKT